MDRGRRIYMTDEIDRLLDELAAYHGCSRAQVVATLITQEIERLSR